MANQNPFQGLNPNLGGDGEFEESDEEESELSLFYDDTYVSEEAFADLDLPPIFDEEIFDKESMIADFDLPPVFIEEIFEKESVSNLGFMDCFCESHVSHHKDSSVYLLLSKVMINEFVSFYWSDWIDIMTRIEGFKVRCIRLWLLALKKFMQVCGMKAIKIRG